ncbi:MAG TPA: hypothetical protein VG818_04315, partial [Gemmatimonadaceae bacterium]|nr:hypothetical protein [Gemmatimonadaceae bacterium]
MAAPPRMNADARRDDWRLALAVLAAAGVIRLAFAALIPLFPDETYYWEWSRHLAGGYFDHPSGIARLIALGTGLAAMLGKAATPVAVRCFSVIAGFVGSLAAAGIARRIAGDRAALIAAVTLSAMPLAAA